MFFCPQFSVVHREISSKKTGQKFFSQILLTAKGIDFFKIFLSYEILVC